MVENKSSIFGIIAIIIGATGLGLGAFSAISLQVVEGEQGLPGDDGTDGINGTDGIDGIDAPGYFCSSAVEVQQALDSIGKGSGTIIITASITLPSKINISGGGSYVIQGQGAGTTITCNGNWNAFDITNATYCAIKDLKIISFHSIGLITAIMNITEINDNPVYIENIQIVGISSHNGYGIHIGSENVWISDCHISEAYKSIYQTSSIGIAHIYDNTILKCSYGIDINGDNNHISGNSMEDAGEAIRIMGSYNMVTNNLIINSPYGIQLFRDNNTIKANNMYSIDFGILSFDCNYNIISGNSVLDGRITGIFLENCTSNVISGNLISYIGSDGIFLENCTSNVISGNQISFGKGNGIYLYYNSDYNIISGNSIINLYRDTPALVGISLRGDADFNTIIGNGVFNCHSGITGHGIRIIFSVGGFFNCNNNTVIGNTALNNDINWMDAGINTFGNSTNNNFG